jgi:hypothetical protein
VQKERKIEPDLTLAAAFLEKWVPKLNQDYELRKSLASQGDSSVLALNTPIQLQGLDDVRTVLLTGKSHFAYKISIPTLFAAAV